MVEQNNKKRSFDDTNPLTKSDNTPELTKSKLIRDDENAFPRGGASALTPLELKQVANEAAGDVLFENDSSEATNVSKKRKTLKNQDSTDDNEDEDMRKKFQHLTYKTITKNSHLLGRLIKVNDFGLTFEFEDGLFGYCSIENISSNILPEDVDMDENSDVSDEEYEEEKEDKKDDDVKLQKLFLVGTYYTCKVIENHVLQNSTKKGKKKLTVSINPQDINKEVDDADILQKGATVQGSIKTIEDHGCVIDLGLEDTKVSAFLPLKEFNSDEQELIKKGNVFLFTVLKTSGRVVTLTRQASKELKTCDTITNIESVLPGAYVKFLVDSVDSQQGVFGKLFGSIPAILSLAQLNNLSVDAFEIGENYPVRVVSKIDYKNFAFMHVSQINTIINLSSKQNTSDAFPIGFKFEEPLKIIFKDNSYVYVKLNDTITGCIHLSKIEGDISSKSNQIKESRIVSFNQFNEMYVLTNLKSQIDIEYLTIRDIPIGTILSGEVREVDAKKGVTLKLMNGFVGKVLMNDLSDIKLNYPERKFKIGTKVKGRVLSINLKNGQVMMTLRKQLVNSFQEDDNTKIITGFEGLNAGDFSLATVDSFNNYGVTVKFFNNTRGFIPKNEVSDAFVKDASKFLKVNQIVKVKILEVDESKNRIIASCKLNSKEEVEEVNTILDSLVLGRSIEECIVVEKTKDSIIVELLKNRLIRGVVYVGHLSDSRIEMNRNLIKKITIGQQIQALVIDKDAKTKIINFSMKQSLITSAVEGKLPTSFEQVTQAGTETAMFGYIKSISQRGIFVGFNGKFVGLVLPSYTGLSREEDMSSKFYAEQSVKVYLLKTDPEQQRFLLSFIPPRNASKKTSNNIIEVINPVDESLKTLQDLTVGNKIKVQIKSNKRQQLNVFISENIHGRIDLTQLGETIDVINSKKQSIQVGQIIDAFIVGQHDVKAAKYLPVTNNLDKNALVELSLINKSLKSFDDYKVEDEVVGYVNNTTENLRWITISPSVKGKVTKKYLKNTVSEVSQLSTFKIIEIDNEHKILNLEPVLRALDLKSLNKGDKLEANVIAIEDTFMLFRISGCDQQAIAHVTDILNNFETNQIPKEKFTVGMKTCVFVKDVDVEKKRLSVSLLKNNKSQVELSSLTRGTKLSVLVKKITDAGVFVFVSNALDGFIPVSLISDSYLKDWKRQFKPLQVIKTVVIRAENAEHITLSSRESDLTTEDIEDLGKRRGKYGKEFVDVEVGKVYDGVVRGVTDFGVFINLEGFDKVSGLAHKMEISDNADALKDRDLNELFGEGDSVRCYVIKKNDTKKQLSLSLKGSKVNSHAEEVQDEDEDDVMDVEYNNDSDSDEEEVEKTTVPELSEDGLSLSTGFDWTGKILEQVEAEDESDSDDETADFTKKTKASVKKVVDKTIALTTETPQSNADFERLILSDPNNSVNWLNFTAFQLTVGEVAKAREILERALNTINYREEQEKLNIWVARLNLEYTFGSSESLNEAFVKACSYMDDYVMHVKLIMIYTSAGKLDDADKLYTKAIKKFGSERLAIWEKYGEFLLSTEKKEEAHLLLVKALKQLPKREHVAVVKKFCQLEYKYGDIEQGRTLMEGLLVDASKRIDLWNVYIDLEIKYNSKQKTNIEDLFERCVANPKINKKQAKFFFKKWVEYEESHKDSKMIDYVAAKASEYIRNNQ
ncbi:hypothetical protein ACO0R3_000228 [Hanseniaspora guilliermondii]